jgi:uncharacterized membrane protein YkoI
MEPTTNPAPKKHRSVALLSAGLLVGGAAAGALVVSAANAATTDASLTSSTEGYAAPGQSGEGRTGDGRHFRDDSSSPVRGDEKPVGTDVAAKLKAAALKAVPGGTVIRVETDAGDAAYEAHMTKSDGTRVTVKFDKDYAVTGVEDGMGKGDPQDGGHGHGGQRSPGDGSSGEGAGA